MIEDLLKPQELADELGIKISTIYYWSHIGYIPVVKLGRLLRFRKSSISKWLQEKESKGRIKRSIDIRDSKLCI